MRVSRAELLNGRFVVHKKYSFTFGFDLAFGPLIDDGIEREKLV